MWELIVSYILNSSKEKRDGENRLRHEENRQIENFHNKVDENSSEIIQMTEEIETELFRDPVGSLGLTYTENSGFNSNPIDLSSKIFKGTISLKIESDSRKLKFNPKEFNAEYASLQVLDELFTRWGTVFAIKITNHQKHYNIPSNWCVESKKGNSFVYIIDKDNSEYYYPISSTMKGEIVTGYPKIELIAFSPFRKTTNNFDLYMSNIPLQNTEDNRDSFIFEYNDDELSELIEETLDNTPLVHQISESVYREGEKLKVKEKSSRRTPLLTILIILLILGFFISISK